jgi:dipeptidyl aminopeptidase/acylaminoacyl peptidase
LKGKLMMVGGTSDWSTFTDIMKMSKALIDAGIQHEVVPLPGQPHGYFGKNLDYFLEKQTRFFEKHLKPY